MKKVAKILGGVLGGLVLVALAGFALASMKASAKLSQHFESHRIDLPEPAALPEAIARGKHLVEARYGCNVCHGANFAGGVMIDDPAIGSIRGPNITPGKGGRVASYKIADWDRIVRHGIKPDGSPAVMPAETSSRCPIKS